MKQVVRQLFGNKRGVSEIIASLMLVMVVSAAGVILYSYSLGAFSSSSSLFQLETSSKEDRAQERFSVVAVWWDLASSVNVTLFNHGQTELIVDVVYVDGTPATSYASGQGVTVGKSELVYVRFTSPVTIVSGTTYELLVVSKDGGKSAVYWKA